MSFDEDLARNRAVFAALSSVGNATPSEVALPLPPLSRPDGSAQTAQPLPPPASQSTRGAGAGVIPSGEEPAAKRTVYSLGTPPDLREGRSPRLNASLHYPETEAPSAIPPEEDALVSDDAYQTLLRRFDADARRDSQLLSEEG